MSQKSGSFRVIGDNAVELQDCDTLTEAVRFVDRHTRHSDFGGHSALEIHGPSGLERHIEAP